MEEINLNEEIVFDDVVNEVSIVDDDQNRNQNLIVQTSGSNVENNLNQFIQTSIKSPVHNTGQVTSIKNVTPNFKNNKQSSLTSNNQSKLINNIVITPKTSPQVKKASSNTKNVTIQNKPATPTTINISPSSGISLQNNQILTKVIMTTGGQQLLLTSPIKGNTRTETSNNLSNQTSERQLMAILPVSPNKQQSKLNTSTSSTTNVSIRPKPANITISSPSLNQSSDSKPQYQIIRLVTATTNGNGNSTVNTISTSGLKQIGQNVPGQQHKVLIPASALKNLNASQLLSTSGSTSQLVMYAPTVVQQSSISTPTTPKTVTFSTANVQPIAGGISSSNLQQRHSYVPILPNPSTVISNSASKTINQAANQKSLQNGSKNGEESIQIASTSTLSSGPSSNRPRKPCNCTRSQCLKLYCDCFANGEFCSNCNCINCSNNLDHEEHRQKAIKQCLERNPHAFHPKIGKGKATAQEGIERRHTKGCNCRRSGCLKNYCECYEAKILCTDLCKCCACKNYEDSYERKSLMHLVDAVDIRSSLHGTSGSNFIGKENDPLWGNEFRPKLPVPLIPEKLLSCSFVTNELVDATCQCLIAQAEKSQKLGLNPDEVEKSIIEEFGNCLVQIIDVAKKEKQKEK